MPKRAPIKIESSNLLPTKNVDGDTFIPISSANARLHRGMYGGLSQRPAVAEAMKMMVEHDFSIRDMVPVWESDIRKAATILRQAIHQGAIPLFCVHGRPRDVCIVPPAVAARIIAHRDHIPDCAVRLRRADPRKPEELCDRYLERALLTGGELIVRLRDFQQWYKNQRKRKSWPSQSAGKSKTPRRGRPTVDRELLQHAIIRLANAEDWKSSDGVSKLWRKLLEQGILSHVPSEDTLARVLKEMHLELGDFRFQVRTRKKKWKSP